MKSKRLQQRERIRRQKLRTNLIWVGIGLAVALVIGVIAWQGARPSLGQAIPEMVSSPHIPTDTDPGTYNSDPPTSGLHYPTTLTAGFYDSNELAFPAGYLVHNLEHGYVIFWYNCELLDETGCAELKSQIRSLFGELGGTKLIAYPWPSLDVPLVLTSWGRLQKFESFDEGRAREFYRTNLNRAPEPHAE